MVVDIWEHLNTGRQSYERPEILNPNNDNLYFPCPNPYYEDNAPSLLTKSNVHLLLSYIPNVKS